MRKAISLPHLFQANKTETRIKTLLRHVANGGGNTALPKARAQRQRSADEKENRGDGPFHLRVTCGLSANSPLQFPSSIWFFRLQTASEAPAGR